MAIAPPVVYCDVGDIETILSVAGVTDRGDDEGTGILSAAEQGYIASIIGWASSRVNFRAGHLYNTNDMAMSSWVNYVTAVMAAQMLCGRRSNPVPGSITAMYKECIADLDIVRRGDLQIPDIGYRDVAWPAWSNCRVDPMYRQRQTRVQRQLSEQSAVPYIQNVDTIGQQIIEPY